MFEDDKPEQGAESLFHVFIVSDENDKYDLVYYSYDDARKGYDKYKKSKKVTYQEIIDNDPKEKKYFEEWDKEGKIGTEGYPSLSDEIKIHAITFSMISNDKETVFEEYEKE